MRPRIRLWHITFVCFFGVLFFMAWLDLNAQPAADPELQPYLKGRVVDGQVHGSKAEREQRIKQMMAAQGKVYLDVWTQDGRLQWRATIASDSPEEASDILTRLREEMRQH